MVDLYDSLTRFYHTFAVAQTKQLCRQDSGGYTLLATWTLILYVFQVSYVYNR